MQFAGNPNYVSGMFYTILNISKKTIKDLWHGASLEPYLPLTKPKPYDMVVGAWG